MVLSQLFNDSVSQSYALLETSHVQHIFLPRAAKFPPWALVYSCFLRIASLLLSLFWQNHPLYSQSFVIHRNSYFLETILKRKVSKSLPYHCNMYCLQRVIQKNVGKFTTILIKFHLTYALSIICLSVYTII